MDCVDLQNWVGEKKRSFCVPDGKYLQKMSVRLTKWRPSNSRIWQKLWKFIIWLLWKSCKCHISMKMMVARRREIVFADSINNKIWLKTIDQWSSGRRHWHFNRSFGHYLCLLTHYIHCIYREAQRRAVNGDGWCGLCGLTCLPML